MTIRSLQVLLVAAASAWSVPVWGAPSLQWQELRFYAPPGATPENQPAGTPLVGVGVLTGLDVPFDGMPLPGPELEYSVHLTGFSLGTVTTGVPGDRTYTTWYNRGTMDVFQDPTPDHDFGTAPPNATVPASFVDGEPFLQGEVYSFIVVTKESSTSLVGGFHIEARLDGYVSCRGDAVGTLAWDPAGSASGYFLRHEGGYAMDCVDPATTSTWGRVKAGYR